MKAEQPSLPEESMMTPDERRAENRLNGGGANQTILDIAEAGVWPSQSQEDSVATGGLTRTVKPRRKPTPSKVVDGDSGLDPNWRVNQGDALTPEEATAKEEGLAAIRAKNEALERQRLTDNGENADAVLRARAIKRQRGYLA